VAQTIVASIVGLLGVRMLWLGVRGRTLPETWIGLFFVATGAGAELALHAIDGSVDPALSTSLMLAGAPMLTLATVSGYAFTYTVFRRGDSFALAIVVAGTLLALWGTWHQLRGPNGAPDLEALSDEFLLGRAACFAWGAYEAVRAYRMARRRLALGLADPVVTNRFLLFGIWFGVMGVMPITLALSRLYGGAEALQIATDVGPKIVGVIMIAALVLTFFPPRSYLDWVAASARGAV
jgi:hypothetical protein